MRAPFRAVGCAALLFVPALAVADPVDRATAEALFQKGRDAMAAGDLETACPALEESNRLDPAPGTMVNLATCEERRGRLAVAWQWLEQAASRLPESDARRALVLQRAAETKARLPHLTIRLAPGAPADSRVMRDAVELRSVSLGLALPVDPGAHRVAVSAPGRAERRYAVLLEEGERKELVVAPGPVGATTVELDDSAPAEAPEGTPAEPEPAPDGQGGPASGGMDRRTLGYIVGGAGVAGIGTALVAGGLVLGKKSVVEDHCDRTARTCDATGLDAASSGKTLSTVSTVAFAVGVAATGVGVYFLLTADPSSSKEIGLAAAPGGAVAVGRARF